MRELLGSLDREFDCHGRTVRWDRFGTGPAVVFCHGTPWSSALWRPFAEALAGDYTVHLWDMPGYGQSSMDPGHAVGLDFQGEVFAALLAHAGLERPHVVAHDYGGAVSLRAHLLHGADYASLALVDVVALAPWGSEFFRLVAENAEVFSRLPPHIHEGAVRAYVGSASHTGLTAAQEDMLVAPWLEPRGQAAFYRQVAQADQRFTDEVEPRYGEIGIPVKVIWGEDDTWIPVDRAHRLAAAIPGSSLRLIGGAGHLIQLDAPVELATALHGWLASVALAFA
ncbi:alpha/beta fold hydrolase [Glycomyces salinus]|uniref:alpha/beta fold hydrolase n=1 Tax=Glycomyces salinus TaxID=980294 RepID=UPI0018EB1EB9|nr:alpha/beta fold hydrolase [Glycomyces salinus]